MTSSDFNEAVKFANWFVIWGGFLFWVYQIIRSAYLYCKKGGNTGLTLLMHFFLFVANFLYVWYELQYAFVPLYFIMLFCCDIVGIWGLYLITKGVGAEVEKAHFYWFIFCTLVLIGIFIFAVWFPEHGLRCHD